MQRNQPEDQSKKHPLLLPKDNHSSGPTTATIGPTRRAYSGPPPRRSKFGCCTCKIRKVKCDEGRPICAQCIRLGLSCDYNIRVTFRDDTKRIRSQMAVDVTLDGSPVWDPNTPTVNNEGQSKTADELGPFATLTTDEERERKAETAHPGSYFVILNPDSFQHLPQYTDGKENKPFFRRIRPRSEPLAHISGKVLITPSRNDPNVVLLRQLDHNNRQIREKSNLSILPALSKIKLEDSVVPKETEEEEVTFVLQEIEEGDSMIYLQQFRDIVWKQLVQGEAEIIETTAFTSSGVGIIEHAATYFSPLFHAVLAIGALSLSQENSKERMDAFHHYEKSKSTLQAQLQDAQAFSADRTFLTYFLLLIYEIAAGDSSQPKMWSNYVSILLHISKLRHETYGERYPFITWWICNIDLFALLSGAGSGDFISNALCEEMTPLLGSQLYPLESDGLSVVQVDKALTLPQILQLNYKVTLLAVRLGLLAQELRQDFRAGDEGDSTERHFYAKLRQSRVFDLQESLRALCFTILLVGQEVDSLPLRPKQLFYHASCLCWACIIYSHTSMWPEQRLETGPEFDVEIANAESEILSTAQKIVTAGWLELRFIVFPVFIAGYASTDGNNKMIAVELLKIFEKESVWSSITLTRRTLEAVYQRQSTRFLFSGQDRDVGWMEVLAEQGVEVIIFGL